MSKGQKLLDLITSSKLFRIEREGEHHIIVWSSGSEEQLDAFVETVMPRTPDSTLPQLGDGPRRKMVITIEVTADFEKRLDNQWMVEREIHADRWSWTWVDESERDMAEACCKELRARLTAAQKQAKENDILARENHITADTFMKQVKRLQQQLTEARKALEPFAESVGNEIRLTHNNTHQEFWNFVPIGACRQAAASLEKLKEKP